MCVRDQWRRIEQEANAHVGLQRQVVVVMMMMTMMMGKWAWFQQKYIPWCNGTENHATCNKRIV
jgi:hypothetical protein